MRGVVRLLIVALAAGGVMGGGAAWAQSSALKAFFGTYAGASLMPSVEMLPRDLRVSIMPAKADGFIIQWQTLLFKYGEPQRRNSQLLEFRPTENDPSLYEAVESDGSGGGKPPKSPLDGGTFAWAYVQGKLMSIHILSIVERGGYVLQTYDRTLNRAGMSLAFTRVRNGTVEQRLRAELNRIEG